MTTDQGSSRSRESIESWSRRLEGLNLDFQVTTLEPELLALTRAGATLLVTSVEVFLNTPWYLKQKLDRLTGPRRFLLVGELELGQAQSAHGSGLVGLLGPTQSDAALSLVLEQAWESLDAELEQTEQKRRLVRTDYELRELIEITRALITERETERLLGLILEKSRFITGADAGSLYVVEGDDTNVLRRRLHFKLSQNDSVSFDAREFTMPISRSSMAGWVALEKTTLRIADVYHLPSDSPFGFDRSFDERVGYRTRSVLCTPLVSSRGDVLGVIQLINKKLDPRRKLLCWDDFDQKVVPFDDRSHELLLTLAAQAGVALETAVLYQEIRGLFDGFVRASVDAIESRDPTTSGHSRRVARLSLNLAEAVSRTERGTYAETRFDREQLRELEVAALLHDFGKIGVRENVLVKAKKLYPDQLERLRARFDYALAVQRAELAEAKLESLRRMGSSGEHARLDAELERRRCELEQAFELILSANEPTVLSVAQSEALGELTRLTMTDNAGLFVPLVQPEELESLRVTRGSLTPSELEEIRSHVSHTYRFLSRIPWGRNLSLVPAIAGCHHERCNGTGYPQGLGAEQIPLQSKIMSIADIFDALTASDRPYKRAVPVDRALTILGLEVKDGHLDPELVSLFVEARAFELDGLPA